MKKIIGRNTISDYICRKVLAVVGQTEEISDLDRKKLLYYIHALYMNTEKIIILLTVALIADIFWEVIIAWIFFALLRRTAFGIHSSSTISCTITTILTFIMGGLVSKYANISSYELYMFYLISFITYIVYAPADTESRPLVGKKLRKKFKNKTILRFIILFIGVMILNIYKIKVLFAMSALTESISILPITYKIFRRRYRNYECFKKDEG